MIVVFHKNNKVVQIYDYTAATELFVAGNTMQQVLINVAKKNNDFIGWSHISLKKEIDLNNWRTIFKHQLIMASFEISKNYFIDDSIGFVEDTPFINVNKKVNYPTWLMSSDVGGIHASVLLKFEWLLQYKFSFSYFLNSVSKIGMKQGLLCYSNPKLLKSLNFKFKPINKEISKTDLLWFIKSNYRFRWVLLYLFNAFIYKKETLIFPFLKVLFKKSIANTVSLKDIKLIDKNKLKPPTIDVLIPTLGREKYLKDVLIDLAEQTLLPKKVIIVEQNPNINKRSELHFLSDEWPFKINHIFIHQLGACNARNIALQKVTSDWVFFADDDIKFKNNTLENAFKYISLYNAKAVTISCLRKKEQEKTTIIKQWNTFGTNASIVNYDFVANIKFDLAYEFGYGEDADFGMQLRNNGIDILYVPFVKMIHIKAPVGGFREKFKQEWEYETLQPKPSPTIMLFKLKYATKEQLQGYKTILFFKFYKFQPIKNPYKYIKIMNKRWGKSMYWANFLIKKHSNEI